MNSITLPRRDVREIEEVEPALKAALGADYAGMSLNPREAIIYLVEKADETRLALAQKVFIDAAAAIDRTKPSPANARAQRQRAALHDVNAADFKAVYAQIAGLTGAAAALKPILVWMLRMIYSLTLAQGLTDKAAPDEDEDGA